VGIRQSIHVICYKIRVVTTSKTNEKTGKWEACRPLAALDPGGNPRWKEACMAEVNVVSAPSALVVTTTVTVGAGVIAGKDVTFESFFPKIALYVLVARADATIPPVGAWIDELNTYSGVEMDGVGRREFGSVVATVADIDDKKA